MTKRQQAESSRAQAWLAHQKDLILTSTGEGIFGTDPAGIVNFVNPAAAGMLGYGRNELLGCDAHATFHHTRPDGSPVPA